MGKVRMGGSTLPFQRVSPHSLCSELFFPQESRCKSITWFLWCMASVQPVTFASGASSSAVGVSLAGMLCPYSAFSGASKPSSARETLSESTQPPPALPLAGGTVEFADCSRERDSSAH